MGPICETDVEVFDEMMRKNARTCYVSCRAAARRLRAHEGGGRIVNVAARNALFPELGSNMVAYTASKAAVGAITQALGAELASDRIWVNAVVPSTIDTPANRRDMPDADHDTWPTCAEIAETICFLASPENRATRSALVPVYGRA
jgi:NAD(P)-dependent dehydrogenase (short-subunit alcohol dehydrogenase family)